MIRDPIGYAPEFAAAGAHVLTFHWEATGPRRTAEAIARYRELKVPVVGISINPDTRPEVLAPYLKDLDLVLVMSVYPGFGGQAFLPETLEKVRWLRAQGFTGRVEMDGGLNQRTLPLCAAAGADVLVSGSAIFGSPDLSATIQAFRQAARAAAQPQTHRP
jgi:ribulose-phosphate 3-epimerase